MRVSIWFVTSALALMTAPRFLRSECIGPANACDAFSQVAYVFVGTTLDVEILEPNNPNSSDLSSSPMRIQMRIDRSFKGVEHLVGKQIEFHEYPHETWIRPHPGERYLVFTNQLDRFVLDMCRNTTELREAYDLSLIERIAQGRKAPGLTGVFRSWADDYAPVSGVKFRLQRHGFGITGMSSKKGLFTIEKLKPGSYTLFFDHPSFDNQVDPDDRMVHVSESGCGFLSVRLGPNNRIVGRLLDPDGRPIRRGYVALDAVGPKWGEFPPWAGEDSGRDGRFVFHGLLPGLYRVSVPWLRSVGSRGLTAEQAADETTAYYPGTLLKDEAETIVVPRLGEVNLGDFRLPPMP